MAGLDSMTVNEIYTYIGQKLFDSIPEEIEDWEKAVMHCKRLDRFFTGGGKLYIGGSKEIRLDEFEAGWEMTRYNALSGYAARAYLVPPSRVSVRDSAESPRQTLGQRLCGIKSNPNNS